MDAKEKERRLLEKAMRKPLKDVVLDVQDGKIDIKDLFAKIDKKVKERTDGKISR